MTLAFPTKLTQKSKDHLSIPLVHATRGIPSILTFPLCRLRNDILPPESFVPMPDASIASCMPSKLYPPLYHRVGRKDVLVDPVGNTIRDNAGANGEDNRSYDHRNTIGRPCNYRNFSNYHAMRQLRAEMRSSNLPLGSHCHTDCDCNHNFSRNTNNNCCKCHTSADPVLPMYIRCGFGEHSKRRG